MGVNDCLSSGPFLLPNVSWDRLLLLNRWMYGWMDVSLFTALSKIFLYSLYFVCTCVLGLEYISRSVETHFKSSTLPLDQPF